MTGNLKRNYCIYWNRDSLKKCQNRQQAGTGICAVKQYQSFSWQTKEVCFGKCPEILFQILHTVRRHLKLSAHLDFISGEQVGHCASEFSIVRSKRCVRCIDRNQHPFIHLRRRSKMQLMVGQDNITVCFRGRVHWLPVLSVGSFFVISFGQFIWLWFFKAWTKGSSHYLVLFTPFLHPIHFHNKYRGYPAYQTEVA